MEGGVACTVALTPSYACHCVCAMQRLTLLACVCSSCGCTLEYDGQEDGIFNYSNKTLLTHELGHDYADSMPLLELTFAAHYRMMEERYGRTKPPAGLFSRNTHSTAIQAFMHLLRLDFNRLFNCPICSMLPHDQQVFLLDGKEMGINHVHFKPYKPPVNADVQQRAMATVDNYAPLPDSTSRKLLDKWVAGQDKQKNPFNNADAAALRVALTRHMPDLWLVIEHMGGKRAANGSFAMDSRCPKLYRHFMAAIAAAYPASSLVPPAFAATQCWIDFLRTGKVDVDTKRQLLTHCPVVHKLVSELGCAELSQALRAVLHRLAAAAAQPLGASAVPAPQSQHLPVANPAAERDHVFMPGYPLQRDLPSFVNRGNKDPAEGTCNKFSNAHKLLSPGVITLYCPHGICLGYKLMATAEGVGQVADIFFTRLTQGPKCIIYDNACNLHRHVTRWMPQFFANTRFRIDRIHSWNHTACGTAYFMHDDDGDELVVPGVTVRKLNTQVTEQTNAQLDRIRTQVAYSTHDNASNSIRHFLASRNSRLIAALNAA